MSHGGSRGRRRGGAHEEEHENHERWLVTYADMLTLLMVLFIVMFAISQVDQKRFNALKDGLAAGFGESVSVLDGADSVMEQPGVAPIPPISPAQFSPDVTDPQTTQAVQDAVDEAARLRNERQYAEAAAETDRLDSIRRRLLNALRAHGLQDDVRMVIDDRGLTVSLVSRHIVFAPDSATLTDRGIRVLDVLAPVLRDIPDDISVDGHTNQVKVKPRYFPTDWELSAARAVTVLRRLAEVGNVPAKRLSATAFGHERPLIDPDRAGSQALNKRVDIVVLSGAAAETRALINQVVADRSHDPSLQTAHQTQESR